ncbi:hypothetical protein J2W56_006735 [Nocardia kruczakiae]|uniref:Uncharacterized protein n=1 Tax=Nocardia kruczakiae TaxID=261477 RepID=A0ABU1XRF9_9NOCA|nr:hypothetical protein [Nocardia kruczakiae]
MNLLAGDLMLLLLDRGVGGGDILTGMRPPVSRRE